MNIYQRTYINQIFKNDLAYLYSTDMSKPYSSISIEKDDIINIVQDEDINIQKYILVFNSIKFINDVLFYHSYDNKNWTEIKVGKLTRENREFEAKSLEIDFAKPIKYIKIVDKNKIIDDIVLKVIFVEADKEKYYSKIEAARKELLLKNAHIKHATGIDLVNIYFQPCCEEYTTTAIILYTNDQLFMAKYQVDKDFFFKSISGLAYGTYYYEAIQYDKNNKELIKTPKTKFSIINPSCY